MRDKMKAFSLFLVFTFLSGMTASCSRQNATDLGDASQSDNGTTYSAAPTSTPSPAPSPTPTSVPHLAKMVEYYDPSVIGPKTDGNNADRKSEDKYLYLECYDEYGNVIYTSEYYPEVHEMYTKSTYVNEEFEYSDDGKLIKEINQHEQVVTTTYDYDDQDRLVKETNVIEDKGASYPYTYILETSYDCDESGRVVKKSTVKMEEGEYLVSSFEESYTYDENGFLETETSHYTTQYYGEDGAFYVEDETWENRYTYDDQGNLIGEKKHSDGRYDEDNTYKYDDSGRLIEEKTAHRIIEGNKVYPYDHMDTYYEYEGDLLVKTTLERYGTYADIGGEYKADPVIHIYEYNDLGNVIYETIINKDGVIDPWEGVHWYSLEYLIYSYNEDDLLESIQSYWTQTDIPDLTVEDIMNEDCINGKKLYKYYYE